MRSVNVYTILRNHIIDNIDVFLFFQCFSGNNKITALNLINVHFMFYFSSLWRHLLQCRIMLKQFLGPHWLISFYLPIFVSCKYTNIVWVQHCFNVIVKNIWWIIIVILINTSLFYFNLSNFYLVIEDDLGDGDDDSWSSFNQSSYNGNLARSTSYIFLETILEETSDDLRTDSERSSEEGNTSLTNNYWLPNNINIILILQ